MKKSIKDLGGDPMTRTFTVRIQESVIGKIRSRATSLDMNHSYYIAALCTLEVNHSLLDQFPDPLASGEKITAEEALELVKKLQQSGIDLKSLLSPEKLEIGNTKIPPEHNKETQDNRGMPRPMMPKMRTIEELVRLNAQQNPANPDPAISAALSGDTGVGMKMREIQLKEIQEERTERAMRDKILKTLPEANGENTK